MIKKENFLLDATLKDVIDDATFNAVLPNGHEIVAYSRSDDKEAARLSLRSGQRVQVEMSPYDMSRGAVYFGK
jgi:translation initiation factor IF-1